MFAASFLLTFAAPLPETLMESLFMEKYLYGIDFGTTNSALAIYNQDTQKLNTPLSFRRSYILMSTVIPTVLQIM